MTKLTRDEISNPLQLPSQEPYGWHIKGMENAGMRYFFTVDKIDADYWQGHGMTLVPVYLQSQAQQQITKDAIQHGTGIGLVVDGKLQHVKPEDFYLSSEDEKNIKMREQLESLPFAASQAQQPTDLSKQLREYAADSGYSHNDYADTMLAAASEIERCVARLAASQAQQTESHKIAIYEQALKDVQNPIAMMQRNLEEGYRLDGHAALRAHDNPQTYKEIAAKALHSASLPPAPEGDKP